MKKLMRMPAFCLIMLMFMSSVTLPVHASKNAIVVEKYTAQDGILLYVKGSAGTVGEASYQVGVNACTIEEIGAVKESGETIYTLILWDNSLSVMKREGDRIRDILIDIIANRASDEKFSIALIDSEITYLTEYIDDYAVLKQTVESVEGENQDAYIIENLYEAILDLNRIPDEEYKRIFLISDGMDATEIGYSKAELDALIEKTPYPIYTMGMLVGSHTEELQDLFALSRTTGAEYFYMNELEEVSSVAQTMSAELNLLRVKVLVPEEIRDGSVQNSQLVLEAGAGRYTLQCQVTLPFAETDSSVDAEQSGMGEQEGGNAAEDAERGKPMTGDGEAIPVQADVGDGVGNPGGSVWLVGGVAGAVILIFTVILIVVLVKRKKAKRNVDDYYDQLDQRLRNERHRSSGGRNLTSSVGAEIPAFKEPAGMGVRTQREPARMGSGDTILLLHEPRQVAGGVQPVDAGKRILLTDMADSVRTYGCGISDRVVIGRSSARCNLAITTDDAVSERHCEIECRGGQFHIRDLGSANGTYVNGIRINKVMEVQTGFVIRIGRAQYRLTIE